MGAFYLEFRDTLKTTLLTRITAHKQCGSKHKHYIQLFGNNVNDEVNLNKFMQIFMAKIVLCHLA